MQPFWLRPEVRKEVGSVENKAEFGWGEVLDEWVNHDAP